MKGKVTHWNEAKGFGFITPASGAKRVFADLSAFSNSYIHPRVGQMVTFSLSTDKSGRPRAEDVVGAEEPAPPAGKRLPRPRSPGRIVALLSILLAAAVVYSRFNTVQVGSYLPFKASETSSSHRPTPALFHCDGRTHCAQMTSCAEAEYFIQNCPGTRMDGDGDGIPCERQWCN